MWSFYFINDNIDFYQDCSGKLFKITKHIYEQWKDNEFRRSKLAVTISLNFCIFNYCNLFISSLTIRTFIKTIVVSHWKQLNLFTNNEKVMNLKDLDLLSLLISILSSILLYTISYLIFCFYLIFYILHLLSYLSPCILYIMSLILFLTFIYYLIHYIFCLIFCFYFLSCVLYLLSCLLSYLLSSFYSCSNIVDLLVFSLEIISLNK